MTSKVWADALEARDPVALELIDGAVWALGVAIANAVAAGVLGTRAHDSWFHAS